MDRKLRIIVSTLSGFLTVILLAGVFSLAYLGSYSTVDFSSGDISVLSIYGENDGVMNRDKYEENKKNLPSDTTEYIIEGGNHAGFGMYGHQIGDKEAAVTSAEQIAETVKQIFLFIKS